MLALTPTSPAVALLPITAQGVMPPPAGPSTVDTPPVNSSFPVSAQACPVPRAPAAIRLREQINPVCFFIDAISTQVEHGACPMRPCPPGTETFPDWIQNRMK